MVRIYYHYCRLCIWRGTCILVYHERTSTLKLLMRGSGRSEIYAILCTQIHANGCPPYFLCEVSQFRNSNTTADCSELNYCACVTQNAVMCARGSVTSRERDYAYAATRV